MRVVRLGVKLDGYEEAPALEPRPFTVGYLARIAPEKGLQLLAESFHHLAARVGPEKVRLRAAGWLSPAEHSYLDGIHERMRSWGLAESFEYVGEVDRAGKIEFLRSLDVLSVPTAYRDPKGIFVLEALAAGVPVVQPRHGAFPELVEATGGGLLVEPGSAEALADAFADLMEKPEKRRGLGRLIRKFNDMQSFLLNYAVSILTAVVLSTLPPEQRVPNTLPLIYRITGPIIPLLLIHLK